MIEFGGGEAGYVVSKSKLSENPFAKLPPGPPWYIRADDPAPGATRVCLGLTRIKREVALMPCNDPGVLRFETELEAARWLLAYYLEKCTTGRSPLALIVEAVTEY